MASDWRETDRMSERSSERVHYQALDVLTVDELADALRCSVRHIERQHFPCIVIGERVKRYVWGQVVDYLTRKAAA
jgi:hypothetical protein